MTDLKYPDSRTLYTKYALTALLCEENGFWPDVIENKSNDDSISLNWLFLADHRLEYVREVTSIQKTLLGLFDEIFSNTEYIQKAYEKLSSDACKEEYTTCHIEVIIKYQDPRVILNFFYCHDNDYDDRIYFVNCDDIDIINDILIFMGSREKRKKYITN